jgi:hypothetical protein
MTMTPFDEEAYGLGILCTIISLLGSLFIFLTFSFIKETRKNFFFTMGVYLAISDVCLAMSSFNLFDPVKLSHQTCETLGFLREFAILSSFMWTSLISYAMWRSIKYNLSDDDLFRDKMWYLVMGYLPPLVGALIPAMTNSYGTSWVFCWIHTDRETFPVASTLFLYAPFMASFVISIACFIKAHVFLRTYVVDDVSSEFYRLLLYPLISFACNVGGMVFMIEAFTNNGRTMQEEPSWLVSLRYYHLIARQLQGLFTAMAYGMNYHVRLAIKHKLKKSSCINTDDIVLEEYAKKQEILSTERRDQNLQEFISNREALISKAFSSY